MSSSLSRSLLSPTPYVHRPARKACMMDDQALIDYFCKIPIIIMIVHSVYNLKAVCLCVCCCIKKKIKASSFNVIFFANDYMITTIRTSNIETLNFEIFSLLTTHLNFQQLLSFYNLVSKFFFFFKLNSKFLYNNFWYTKKL